MHILTILKIIGIIILIILGITLLLAFYCLILPISYNFSSNFDKKNYVFRVNDLLRFINISLNYKQNKLSYKISLIFGAKKITGPDKKAKNSDKKEKKKITKQKKKVDKKEKDKDKKTKKSNINYKEIIFEKQNRKTLLFIIKEFFKTLNKLKPKVFRANINYSLGSPDKTGILTGGLSLLSFVYAKKNNIYPDFESEYPYISGKIKIKGEVKLIWFVVLFFRLLCKSSVRRLLQKLL